MKTLLLLIFTASSFLSNAQDTTNWTKDKLETFGTKAEVIHQQSIRNQSDHHDLFRLIGFKQFYANGISSYIQADMDFTLNDNKGGDNVYVFEKNGVFMGVKQPRLIANYNISKDGRIVSARITGMFADLAKLFLTYWPQSADFAIAVQLKPGTAAVKHCYGDLISFKWIQGKPIIFITKDHNIAFPVPPLKN
jgi:hypothetical protein